MTREYDVALHVCRGYPSVSFAGAIGDEWFAIEKPIYAYYCGDFDPSGFDMSGIYARTPAIFESRNR